MIRSLWQNIGKTGNTKGGHHCTIDLLLDWFGLVCFANKTKFFSSHTVDSKPVNEAIDFVELKQPNLLNHFCVCINQYID
jgi:hypothetical protein